MNEERNTSQVSWGARFNTRQRYDASDCPAWVKPGDRDRWVQKGLIVWQQETQHIIRLSATHALHILDDLRRDDAWTEQGIVIGEPVTRIVLNEPERKPEPALSNPIHLSPSQTKAVLRLLDRNEGALSAMSEKEQGERSRAIGRAYRYLIRLAAQKKSEPNDDDASEHPGVSD